MATRACPFCASDNHRVIKLSDELYHVHCNDCGADGPPAKSGAEAQANWDERPGIRSGDGGDGR